MKGEPGMDFDVFRAFVSEMLAETGAIQRRHFRSPSLEVEAKADDSPVTVADRGCEEVMRAAIMKRFPADGILGEEFGTHNAGASGMWVLDPIDGTKSFAEGVPLFGTLVAHLVDGVPRFGAIHQAILGWTLFGDGRTCLFNGDPCRVRPAGPLWDATLLTTDPRLGLDGGGETRGWRELASRVRLYRSWGDCFGYLQVATGMADIMVDPELEPWDRMALIPVLLGAGAHVSGWDGSPPESSRSLVACHPTLADEVIGILSGRGVPPGSG